MIEINLLPKELQEKRKRIELPQIEFAPIIIVILALILSIQLILTITLTTKKYRLKALGAEWTAMKSENKELLTTKKEIDRLNRKIKDIEALRVKRFLWAKKLNDLSDSLIGGVWLTSLSLEEVSGKKYLSIKGGVYSFGKDEAAMVGRFMKTLKENESFFKDFDEIKLGTMQQKRMKDIEAMAFSVNCYFKGKK